MIAYHVGENEVIHDPSRIKFELSHKHAALQSVQPTALFTVTNKTADFGDKYVVRHGYGSFEGGKYAYCASVYYVIADTLEELRTVMPDSCSLLQRNSEDSPVIVETWM